jgi:hypothetical protein
LKSHVSLPTVRGNTVVNLPYNPTRSLLRRSTARQDAHGWTENGEWETAVGWSRLIRIITFISFSQVRESMKTQFRLALVEARRVPQAARAQNVN